MLRACAYLLVIVLASSPVVAGPIRITEPPLASLLKPQLLGVETAPVVLGADNPPTWPPANLPNLAWLKCWDDRHSPALRKTVWAFLPSPSTSDIDAVVAAYRAGAARTAEEKAVLLMTATRDRYKSNPGMVCRHHAMLFYLAGVKLGLDVEYCCYGFGVGLNDAHSWNRITFDGTVYAVDPRNLIYFRR
jgi:hypothetical protein